MPSRYPDPQNVRRFHGFIDANRTPNLADEAIEAEHAHWQDYRTEWQITHGRPDRTSRRLATIAGAAGLIGIGLALAGLVFAVRAPSPAVGFLFAIAGVYAALGAPFLMKLLERHQRDKREILERGRGADTRIQDRAQEAPEAGVWSERMRRLASPLPDACPADFFLTTVKNR